MWTYLIGHYIGYGIGYGQYALTSTERTVTEDSEADPIFSIVQSLVVVPDNTSEPLSQIVIVPADVLMSK